MIKFFRKIRQKLLTENKFSKYLIYAVGEITLVVIGILIAIQLNNMNEDRKERDRELTFLLGLKDDISSDITYLGQQDSIAKSRELSSKKALEVFYKSNTVEDILITDSLFQFSWFNIIVNRKTYDEMLTTSGINILKNKKLRNQLRDYYTLVETFQQFIREMNSDSQDLIKNPNLNSHDFLVNKHGEPWFNIKKIDTTWIGDFNSPTMLALHKFYGHAQGTLNVSRQLMLKSIIEKSNILVEDIEKELKSKNYN